MSTPRRVHPVEVASVLGGGAVLLGSWVAVTIDGGVPQWEAEVFEAINGLPDWLWPIMWLPMQLGSLLGSLAVVAVTFLVTRNRRLALAALVGSQVAWWTAKLVKASVERGRPAAFFEDANLREHAGGLGYVSGHTAVAFALAAALAPSMPRRWRPVALAVACFVGVARIYAGAHLPLDVVGGAGLGVLAGTLARWGFGLGGEGLPPRVPKRRAALR